MSNTLYVNIKYAAQPVGIKIIQIFGVMARLNIKQFPAAQVK
jgi:hypothetical protein